MIFLRESELRELLDMPAAIEAVEAAFAALARGEARLPPPISLDLPDVRGEVHVKGAHLQGATEFVFKVASGFYDNPSRGLPSGSGLMLAFDATTGRPAALLLDNGYLTDLRTGAAGGVAARYLAPQRAETLGVLGAGVQARLQTLAVAAVRTPTLVRLWNRSPERARDLAERLRSETNADVEVVSRPEDAVRAAAIVVTTTPSREAIVEAEWISPGTHVTAMGSDGADKRELAAAVLARADGVWADHLQQCLDLGEIHHAVAEGAISEEDVVGELGQVIVGQVPGRVDEEQVTVADLTGVGVQDAAIAALALERARALGVGRELD